jgi:uracil-DNA glycosylase family protein
VPDLRQPITSLRSLAKAEKACTRCPLYRDATQAVPGGGPSGATVMLVGEQPGDQEDISGKPFVGPAGRMLDRALQEAGFTRDDVFITNAVKHFKHEMRGKRRLHKRPNTYEMERCMRPCSYTAPGSGPLMAATVGARAVKGLKSESPGNQPGLSAAEVSPCRTIWSKTCCPVPKRSSHGHT